jgi:hypothetical protein
MATEDNALDQKIQERFALLPKVVQDAIQSADVEKRMRALAETEKLHLDQWEALENEVMLTLLGFQRMQDLEQNIKSEVRVEGDAAARLASNISSIVFEPIRGELERGLSHPDAKAENISGVEAAKRNALAAETGAPAAPATQSVARAPISEGYKGGEASSARKTVHDDPYRESPV